MRGLIILGGRLKSSSQYGSLFQTLRYWGMYQEKKQEKTLQFLMLYFSLSECLAIEQVIINYTAVLSYLEQRNVESGIHFV